MTAEIEKQFRFEAAHFLPEVPKDHQCHNIHGHSYRLTIRVVGTVDENLGWVMDLAELNKAFAPLAKLLDHSLLNNIEGLQNPTSEMVALWIFRKLEPTLPLISSVTLEATNRVAVTIKKENI
ncbi:MAG: 6-carboxytetrahydropterin synthase QueD [Myxococcales bacterium]|nr:6-carboxytetrahydropterin synthase QueD [Myxococcales bacterium]USN51929.1 MAG: 6-carboxytetrahydropterin synthase QueD [Myxococcales bacterium]